GARRIKAAARTAPDLAVAADEKQASLLTLAPLPLIAQGSRASPAPSLPSVQPVREYPSSSPKGAALPSDRGGCMDEHRYAKYGAATGIVFVIFLIVGFLIVFPQPPDTDASAREWATYFTDHQNAVRAALTIV